MVQLCIACVDEQTYFCWIFKLFDLLLQGQGNLETLSEFRVRLEELLGVLFVPLDNLKQ